MTNTKTNNQNKTQQKKHIPVLLAEVLQTLQPQAGESYLDLTAGYGGHAAVVLERTLFPSTSTRPSTPEDEPTRKSSQLIAGSTRPSHVTAGCTLVDRDQNAIDHLQQQFAGSGIRIIHQDFLNASRELLQTGDQFDLILADLGVSSPHLDSAVRGFSLKSDGPLDMRMDQTQSLTAEVIVNSYSAAELGDLIREYGEEPRARKIAADIVKNRPITSTRQLAQIIAHAWPGHSKVHPATRTFQALRIAVNSELDQIQQALPIWIDLLAPGGRIAVISFHSLEDRLVKRAFQEAAGDRYDAVLKLLNKQPIMAGADELVSNPRARSAKLRAAVKIKNQK